MNKLVTVNINKIKFIFFLITVPKRVTKLEITSNMDELFLKTLDGFVLVLDNNGDMSYLSPNVKDYLGIAQVQYLLQLCLKLFYL